MTKENNKNRLGRNHAKHNGYFTTQDKPSSVRRKTVSTSKLGGRKEQNHPWGEFEHGRRVSPPGMGHHNGEEVEEDEHHMGHHTDDAEGDSHQSGGGEGFDVRSHHGHNSPGGEGLESAHGSERAGCSLEAEDLSCRSHPLGNIPCGESETDMGHGRASRRAIGSGTIRLSPFNLQGALDSYIGNASHTGSFELSSIKLFDSQLQVARRFKFNKPSLVLMESIRFVVKGLVNPPSAILTASLRVNYIEARLPSEILEILDEAECESISRRIANKKKKKKKKKKNQHGISKV